MNVACARCGHGWPEDSDEVRYAYGDWWCRDETDCDDRMADLETAARSTP